MKLNKLMFSLVGLLALALPALAGTAPAKNPKNPVAPAPEEELLGITVGVNYDSRLIYHGINFGEHYLSGDVAVDVPLNDTLRANLEASYGNVFDSAFDGEDYQRLVLGAGVSADLGAAELGLGYRWIHHMDVPDAFADDGHEVGLTLATSAGPVNFGIGSYYDFGDEGWYFEAAVNTEIKVTDSISVVPGVAIGYGIDYAANRTALNEVLDDGFIAVTPSLAVPIKLTSKATLTPYIAARLPIDALDDTGSDDYLYGGVSINVKF